MASKVGSRTAIRAISRIAVSGFKSIHTRQAIEIRPLTILAGANSSGKSSMMQTLLLLKQTLEAPYDPGPLLIYGPNVKFSQVKQMFFHSAGTSKSQMIEIELHFDGTELRLSYSGKRRRGYGPPELVAQTEGTVHGEITLNEHYGSEDAIKQFKDNTYWNPIISAKGMNQAEVIRNRCFLEARLSPPGDLPVMKEIIHFFPGRPFISHLKEIIHVPGLRGNPERAYPVTAIGETFPGTFEDYAASVIAHWGELSDSNLDRLGEALAHLGLTWKVHARAVDDTKVELRVGRLIRPKQGGASDLVNIADVGFGISQTLPVVVALLTAGPGQIVFIEQPEIHLHPRAQVAMAEVLAKAAKRGVRVVIETHSSLLLLGVQSLVAEGILPASDVALHWFLRHPESGVTTVRSAELDEAGRFGDWPEDFGEVALEAESRYLSAAEARIVGR
jgi:putative AbiEii toxin of type IV toxin-antitoxin system/AAA ATPase-like protein